MDTSTPKSDGNNNDDNNNASGPTTPWSKEGGGGGGGGGAWATTTTQTPGISRRAQHEKLREYETKRRLAHASRYDTMALYWKSYGDLLSAGLQETARAQRLVKGTSRAHQLYSNAMKAMFQDVFLDEKGNVATEKQQKRLATTRKKTSMGITSGISGSGSNSTDSVEAKKHMTVLREIRDSQEELSQRFGENAANMDEEIADAIASLLEDLKLQNQKMEKLGGSILSELEKTEQEVTSAWGAYLSTIQSSFDTSPPSVFSSLPSPAQQEMAQKTATHTDSWLVEMQYRVTVAYQNAAWEKGSIELNKLFKNVKEEECLRRTNLREFLVAFAQRQQRLYLSLPGINNQVMDELVAKEMTKDEIEKNVETIISSRAAKYSTNKSTTTTTTTESGTDDATKNDNDDISKLDPPLKSDLLTKAGVIERRSSVGVSHWRLSLAVITSDSFLHFFDLELTQTMKLGSNVEDAFTALVPELILPTAENQLLGKSNFSRGWSDILTPSMSVILGNCTIQLLEGHSLELIETVASTGASKMFAKSVLKKVRIRTSTKQETEDWIAALTA